MFLYGISRTLVIMLHDGQEKHKVCDVEEKGTWDF